MKPGPPALGLCVLVAFIKMTGRNLEWNLGIYLLCYTLSQWCDITGVSEPLSEISNLWHRTTSTLLSEFLSDTGKVAGRKELRGSRGQNEDTVMPAKSHAG